MIHFLFILRLAVGVSQHGSLEEKLRMAFDIYGRISVLLPLKKIRFDPSFISKFRSK